MFSARSILRPVPASFALLICLSWVTGPQADETQSITIAAASNFMPAMAELSADFTDTTGIVIRTSFASTGKLFAQISNGAPFDILLAADGERPRKLEAAGLGVAGSRFTYATGRLVLWSRDPALQDRDCREHLSALDGRRLAIANPDTSPYGAAARETLRNLGLWTRVEPELVTGENITQALQFTASGNARLGFIAWSQSLDDRLPEATCTWQVPERLHRPIEQQAILLNRARDSAAAQRFIGYLRGERARTIIGHFGYTITD